MISIAVFAAKHSFLDVPNGSNSKELRSITSAGQTSLVEAGVVRNENAGLRVEQKLKLESKIFLLFMYKTDTKFTP